MSLPRSVPTPVQGIGALLSDYQARLRSLELVAHSHDTSSTRLWYTVCTSTTRPALPVEGMMILEIDTDRVLVYDGVAWIIMSEPSQSFTPPVANLTAGNGTWLATYHRSDGWIDLEAHFQFGTTSAIAGDLTLSLPISSATVTPDLWTVSFVDTSTGQTFAGQAESTGATSSVYLRALATGSGYAIGGAVGPAAPFAWAPTDRIVIAGRYRMTTRYS